VTVYAFSLENFKRSPIEVDGLMRLAEEKFGQLIDEQEKLIEEQICFRFFGDLTRLTPRLRQLIARLELDTNHFTRGFVNVCMAYTAQDEMRRAMVAIAEGVGQGLLMEEDIDEELINHCLDSRRSPQPDLLIRTSGEKRFSDFLLWQCCTCHVHYDDVLWPEFDYWHLCKAMFAYQRNRSSVEAIVRLCGVEEDERCDNNQRNRSSVRLCGAEEDERCDNNQRNRSSVEAINRLCTAEEDERCDNRRIKFLNWLEERHLDQLRLCLSDMVE